MKLSPTRATSGMRSLERAGNWGGTSCISRRWTANITNGAGRRVWDRCSSSSFHQIGNNSNTVNREFHRWYSPSLGKDMDMLIFGHAGSPMVAFPTSMGRFFEWEDQGMIRALGEHLERGWIQLYCVDSV